MKIGADDGQCIMKFCVQIQTKKKCVDEDKKRACYADVRNYFMKKIIVNIESIFREWPQENIRKAE